MRKLTGDEAALLKAISDNPEEDTPRLIYADWLDEQGGAANVARAEFIRLQIAEVPKRGDYHSNGSLTEREEALLSAWDTAKGWRADLPRLTGITWQTQHYERGFVYHIHATSVRSLLKAAPEVFASAPVTWVSLDKLTAITAKELARSPVLARVRCLDKFSLETWEDAVLAAFADTTHLCNLHTLFLIRAGLSAVGLRPFLTNTSLTRLRYLSLHDCYSAGAALVSAILDSPSASTLEDITLQSCGIGPDVAPLISDLVQLPKLNRVRMVTNRIDDATLTALARVSVTKPVRVGLGYNALTDRGAGALLKGAFMRTPGVSINLGGNQITARMQKKLKDAFGDRVG